MTFPCNDVVGGAHSERASRSIHRKVGASSLADKFAAPQQFGLSVISSRGIVVSKKWNAAVQMLSRPQHSTV
ncbi:hypothetical protein QM467_00745 [Rhodoblastus sp. 17X3]|uniref:hypothetical protein n=1 Tax=Rhodoblastus sp. 17X3 TaxID=3047026 RepID=UPI0024B71A25|nr:hypothetical protein [Rhodoblastus sp. 17X3]MDI9846579.1 hypothetical protein [Rhodoblastus sp. 17X3]